MSYQFKPGKFKVKPSMCHALNWQPLNVTFFTTQYKDKKALRQLNMV